MRHNSEEEGRPKGPSTKVSVLKFLFYQVKRKNLRTKSYRCEILVRDSIALITVYPYDVLQFYNLEPKSSLANKF